LERYLCIHGHFYQPPRENPWLEAVELQDSAYPYHDWNDRITDECYAANARSRILDGQGRIERIVNNYEQISFNFGPTLLSWLEARRPEIYRMILEADKASIDRFGGHGNALAQAHGHIILPLANDRDRRTQVLWGIRDFEHRFGRKPEGMWLPESAANTDSLEALAANGIKFTILAPRQARAIRAIGDEKWSDVSGGIDPTRAYLCRLPSGAEINLFFYDGPVSQGVAFERLLESGEKFADRLTSAFDDKRDWPQLMHIATDGETYGHHHRHGDMALAAALHHIQSNVSATLINYGQFLETHPTTHEVQIVENSSWSCIHGVERWKADCGCNSGGHGDWNQGWRAPLRQALDWLRDTLAPAFESAASALVKDPWRARDEYIRVILDRSPENVAVFLAEHASRQLSEQERVTTLKLLELQRNAMLMYTSCGWFFDELSGIETTQVLQYAARVLQLARHTLNQDLEEGFEERLAAAKSNIPENKDGRWIYAHFVKPAKVDLRTVAAHYAIKSLFDPGPEEDRVYSYRVQVQDAQRASAGRARLLVGRARLQSVITEDSDTITFGVLHMGDHVLNGGVRSGDGDDKYAELVDQARTAFDQADFASLIRAMDSAFGNSSYGLRSLFKDEQRSIMDRILADTLKEIEHTYRQVYSHHAPLMRFLASIGLKAPDAMTANARFVLDAEIRRGLRPWATDLSRARAAFREASEHAVSLDTVSIAYDFGKLLEHLAGKLAEDPGKLEVLTELREVAALASEQPFDVRRWKPRNIYWELAQAELPRRREDPGQQAWVSAFLDLGEKLNVKVP
jgi:alpha-amylase/alpha-mannosidase (GH57 family)